MQELTQSDWTAPEGVDHVFELVEKVDAEGNVKGFEEHELES